MSKDKFKVVAGPGNEIVPLPTNLTDEEKAMTEPEYVLKDNELPVYDSTKKLVGGLAGQSVVGLKVTGFKVKQVKGLERLFLNLEANVSDVGAGKLDIGGLLNSFTNHMTMAFPVGLKVAPTFANKDNPTAGSPSEVPTTSEE